MSLISLPLHGIGIFVPIRWWSGFGDFFFTRLGIWASSMYMSSISIVCSSAHCIYIIQYTLKLLKREKHVVHRNSIEWNGKAALAWTIASFDCMRRISLHWWHCCCCIFFCLTIFFVAFCGRRFSQHLNFFQFKWFERKIRGSKWGKIT